ncbi:alpha/beta hydrolase family protein [Pedobacter gandavensis]|uniref:alpha/beta hydrolase family protein n=1 Tax=Pedobacter gandavensis TaxID=2679963 RepID=UPI002931CE9D|nr:alpha/beta hydrolase family protein [Pedobacter gandavensis]
MVKTTVVATGFLLFICALCFGQKPFDVLDWKGEASLNTYLIGKMTKQYEARKQALVAAKGSRLATMGYQSKVKVNIQQLMQGFPLKSPLNPQITGTLVRDGYRIEKLVYESFKDHHVSANLYLPIGKGPFPAVVLLCGHEDLAKATPSYQQTAILFAKNGFVVLVIDPISQSERHQLVDEAGMPQTKGGTTEHTLLNQSANLLGSSVAVYEVFDNMRGLDYLCDRKEVDPSRIGCIGNSGGGMQVIYLGAMDKRLKLLAPCSYLASRARTLEMTGPADGCAQIPGEGKLQLEMSDYLIAAAPKPVLVLAGKFDFIDYQGTLEAYQDLSQVYADLGAKADLELFGYADGHGLSKPKREAAVTWFRKHFYKDPKPVKEGDLQLLSAEDLWSTPQGKLKNLYKKERSLVDYHLDLYDRLSDGRAGFSKQTNDFKREKIRGLLALSDVNLNVEVEVLDSLVVSRLKDSLFSAKGLRYSRMILRSPEEIPLPFLYFKPEGKIKEVLIWADEDGKGKLAKTPDSLRKYLDQGYALILPDLRGIGETKDKVSLNDPKYQNKEYRNAMFALHLGQSLVGQRVYDLLTLVQFVKQDKLLSGQKVWLRTNGLLNVPAMHAAFLEPTIVQLDLYGGIPSYLSRLQNPLQKDGYSELIPDVLSYYDLPDLMQWLLPIRLISHL